MRILNRYKDKNIEEKIKFYKKQGFPVPTSKMLLENEDIEKIQKGGEINKIIFKELESFVKIGVTTEEINTFVHNRTIELGGFPATLNYNGYPKSTCVSINDVVCHGIPSDRALEDGDIVNIDITTIYDGHFADSSEMFLVGNVSDEDKKLVEVTKNAMYLGIEAVSPYKPINDIAVAIEEYVHSLGYSVVQDLSGHGVGKKFHEEPIICHFKRPEKTMIMVPGMVFTIEPMINMGSFEVDFSEEDGWTVTTADGKKSAQFEHTILVTETGYKILT